MKKKVIIAIAALVSMSCLLTVIALLLENWPADTTYRRIMRFFALLGWVVITYRMITLKYKWLKRLAS
ncbi:MAG: hypothetical protein IJZ86_04405 [Bacteroides sp.]|nr:hypothetical protein [Bacteroides sp.]